MSRIQIGSAGSPPAVGFIKSLQESSRNDYFIGTSSEIEDLMLANVHEKYLIPRSTDAAYPDKLFQLLAKTRPDFLHLQHDYEVTAVSRIRHQIEAMGTKLYLPSAEAIEICADKHQSYLAWQRAGIKVPKTILLQDKNDLKRAFDQLGPTIWIRAIVGYGGRGSLPTDDYEFAKMWIDHFNGWGNFTAAELLTKDTVTWTSIWYEGELVVAQSRKRLSWRYGKSSFSGVSGMTGTGVTCSIPEVDRIATDAILAIDPKPHGIFCVDMTYDQAGVANPTEINIGRFFTTHYFFTKAGINFPEIFCNIALDHNFPVLEKKINPLPDGLIWIRGMDVEPMLASLEELERLEQSSEHFLVA